MYKILEINRMRFDSTHHTLGCGVSAGNRKCEKCGHTEAANQRRRASVAARSHKLRVAARASARTNITPDTPQGRREKVVLTLFACSPSKCIKVPPLAVRSNAHPGRRSPRPLVLIDVEAALCACSTDGRLLLYFARHPL